MEEDVILSLKAGFKEHLVKPVDIQQLQAAIRRVLGRE
jgi:DNA-binding response OmpR family regulator